MRYSDWLEEQTPERRAASLEVLEISRKYGEAQRRSPSSAETEMLRCQIAAHHKQYPS